MFDQNDFVEAWKDAPFDLPSQKLIPMIFSHGYGGQAHFYSGLNREFASHGYLVISMEGNDGSATYTEKEDGTAIPFKYDHTFKDKSFSADIAK